MKALSGICGALMAAVTAGAGAQDELQLDGMAVVGNRELPKALFIVPWKAPEAAMAPDRPVNTLVNEVLQPVDPDVFRRKLEYFETVHRLD
ncbi:MAG: hypothetical protein JSU62_03045 [Gammaproteobacteria bacterium]|nr:MAG: hypothetical protein JSU62_03045 [Gammaproteobacteria bacterium]